MQSIRFGVVADASRMPQELIALAQRAEAAGVSTLLLRDHVVAEPFGDQLGPLVAMTAAAMATSTLRIGSMVFSNDFRPPVQLAKEIATLDQVSGGRVDLGIGAGFLAAEYAPLGIAFDPPGARVSRLAESVRLLKALFSGERASFAGAHYHLEEFRSFPASLQRPHPPIMIAGSGPRMLDLAAREANIIGFQTVTTTTGTVTTDIENYLPETLERKIDRVRSVSGHRFDAIELSTTLSIVLTDDAESAARDISAQRDWTNVSTSTVLQIPSFAIGTIEEIASALKERRRRFGLEYFVVAETALPDLESILPPLHGGQAHGPV